MNALKLSLALFGTTLFSAVVLASGPNMLSSLKVEAQNDGRVKACITDYAGWGESKVKCSAPTDKNSADLASILLLKAQTPETKGLQVAYFREGFSVRALRDSLTSLNCELNGDADAEVAQREAKIQELKKEIELIKAASANRQCE